MPTPEPNYDDKGMVILAPPVIDSSAPPALAENTEAAAPSPIPPVEARPEQIPPVEKSGEAALEHEKKTEGAPVEAKAEELDEDEKALVAKDGEKWSIKAFREAKKELRKFAPAKEALTAIGSPERLSRGLEFVSVLSDPLQPIAEADAKLTALSPSRREEYRNYVYNQTLDQFPDVVLTHILGNETTLVEVVEAVNAKRTGEKPQPNTTKPEVPVFDLTGLDLEGMENDYPGLPAMLKKMAETVEGISKPAAPATEAKPEDDQVKKLTQQLTTFQEEQRTEAVNKIVAEIQTEGEKYYAEVMTVVDDGLRELGLEPDPARDDEATIKLKKQIGSTIRREVEPAFDADPENQKLMERVIKLLASRDASANDYKDLLKARADLAFQAVADPYIDLYNAKRELQSSAKINDKPKHERPEIVGGAAMSNGKPDWRAGKPAGMTTSAWLDQKLAEMPG